MALDVLGAGFGRTGTMSVKYALEKLGFERCYHMMEVSQRPEHLRMWEGALAGHPVDWEQLYAGYRAAVDWPTCSYWRTLIDRYPNAKVVLTVRDGAAWYRSVVNTIYPSSTAGLESEDPFRRRYAEWIRGLIWDGTFDGRIDDEAHMVGVFDAHNAAVIAAVPPERLLVYRPGDGWDSLCAFLDVPVPAEPFPKVNTSEEFNARWERIRGAER
jgi:hypothetical protein